MKKSSKIPLVTTQSIHIGNVEYFTNNASRIDDIIGLMDKYLLNVENAGVEHFGIIALDKINKIIAIEELSQGSQSTTKVSPRKILASALILNASAIILFHNHPKDTAEPSNIDIETTTEIIKILKVVGIDMLDHYIKGTDKLISMYEQGYIE